MSNRTVSTPKSPAGTRVRRRARRLAPLLWALTAGAVAQAPNLPDFGTPADSVLNRSQEAQIGRSIMAQFRSAGAVMDDPIVTEYIQILGARLAGHANDGDHRFEFFMVDDNAINAFALPGGFIGVNSGLLLASERESEVAGVLAHEVAHVTQRHIARSIYASQKNSILSMAAMIAAVLLGAAADADSQAMQGIISASQAAALQAQINYTRSNEHEADRIGIGTLASAGFDPTAMASFFEKLTRRYTSVSNRMPSFLQTHPVTSDRIGEARERARLLQSVEVTDSIGYEVVKARLEVLRAPTKAAAIEMFEERLDGGDGESAGTRYGYALSLLTAGDSDLAQPLFAELVDAFPGVIAFRIGEADAMMESTQTSAALARYAEAIELSPRNVPLTLSYAETLITTGRAAQAHDLLLDLLNNSVPTPEQFRLIARAANAEGDIGNAHHYMSHYYLSIGNLALAFNQIRMALESPGVNSVDRERFQTEFTDLDSHVQEQMRDRQASGNDEPQAPLR